VICKVGRFEAKQELPGLVERASRGERIGITMTGKLAAEIAPAREEVDIKEIFDGDGANSQTREPTAGCDRQGFDRKRAQVTRFVLDASVARARVLDRNPDPYAVLVQQRVRGGGRVIVPALWQLESTNVLSAVQRRGVLSAGELEEGLRYSKVSSWPKRKSAVRSPTSVSLFVSSVNWASPAAMPCRLTCRAGGFSPGDAGQEVSRGGGESWGGAFGLS
jgi:antitoxin (DNA-binding transcriptional repressor) of toxin-antitoxin stability system